MLIAASCLVSCGIITGDTVMEYEDYEITEAMYSYWMARYKTLFMTTYGSDWDAMVDGTRTYAQFFNEYVNDYAQKVLVCMYLFDKYDLEFDSTVKKSVSDRIDGLLQTYGGKSGLNGVLQDYGLNLDTLERIYYEQEKVNVVTGHLFGNGGSMQVSDTDRIAYYKDNYCCFERIYIYTDKKPQLNNGDYVTDLNGNYKMQELSESEKAEKNQLIEDILGKLRSGEKSFVALRAEHSEEDLSVYDYYPNGINVSANDAGTSYPMEFFKALKETEIGEYSVSGDGYGYGKFIIARKPLKEFSELTAQEINMMNNFETHVYNYKSEAYFKTFEPKLYESVMARYDVKEIAQLKYMNI